MAYDSGPRVGFVRIQGQSAPGQGNIVHGLKVIGRGHLNAPVNRRVYVDPKAPLWFKIFVREHADKQTQVRVRVSELFGPLVAYVLPCAESLEELNAIPEAHVHYGKEEVIDTTHLLRAFQFHHEVAGERGLELVEHVRAGKASYSIAEDLRSHARFKISGGYFTVIAADQHHGDKAKIAADRKHLVRVFPIGIDDF